MSTVAKDRHPMLALDSFFHSSSLFGQLRSLVDMPSLSAPVSRQGSKMGTPPTATPSHSAPSRLSNPPKRRRRRVYRPEAGSLYDTMREHAGTSLFVRPICWTDLHARLLRAEFIELPPCDTPIPQRSQSPSRSHMSPSWAASTLSRELTALLSPTQQPPFFNVSSIRTVLSTLYPEALSRPAVLPELNLYFGGRMYKDAVRVQLMWNQPPPGAGSCMSFESNTTRIADSFYNSEAESPVIRFGPPTDAPMLAYLGRSQLAAIRRNLFRVVPGPRRSLNEPVASLQRLRAKSLVPANLDHDAHFLGIFIAMAQRHFYGDDYSYDSQQASAQSMPPFRDTTVRLITHDIDSADFIVYTAVVPARCLELFHRPTRVPRSTAAAAAAADDIKMDSGIRVEFCRVPIWPILGLKERLGKALGRGVVGSFDEDNMERWEERDNTPSKTGSVKRKTRSTRGPLAEVLNRSFEEDSEEEVAAVLQSKRRCLESPSKVGVVI